MPEKPRLSVIIASYNPGDLLERCLESLQNQSTDKTFEIIVVDSSTNGPIQRMGEKSPTVRLYPFPERKFCGDARNFGLSVTRGDIIAFIDADCRADPNWVDQILKAHQSPLLAIGGAISNGNPDSTIGWAAYFCEFSQWMPNTHPRQMTDIAGANMSYKRKIFEEYGRFIEGTYCSDTDFHWRLKRGGHNLWFNPSILVFHCNIDQIGRFLRHEYDHGRSFARVRRNHQDFSEFRRMLYLIFSFLIPSWLFLKIGLRNLNNRIFISHFIKTIPFLMVGLVAWSLGEWTGYLKE
jgi:glycosyltransferase involved in cell wall biosynthesis